VITVIAKSQNAEKSVGKQAKNFKKLLHFSLKFCIFAVINNKLKTHEYYGET
jgi:hypothetical protein